MKKGDVVTHKATNTKMVVIVIGADSQYSDEVKCRYYNPITGEYGIGDFKIFEFRED